MSLLHDKAYRPGSLSTILSFPSCMGQEPSAEGLDALPRICLSVHGLCSLLEGLRGKLTLPTNRTHSLQPEAWRPLLDMGPPVPEAANGTLYLLSLHHTNASKGSVKTPRPRGQARKILKMSCLASLITSANSFLPSKVMCF